MKWKSYLVDSPIWEFIKKVTTSVQDAEWAGLIRLEGAMEKTDGEKIEWRETWIYISEVKRNKCLDSRSNKRWIFRVKYLNDLLPTMYELNRRKPKVYKTNTCIICFDEKETAEHLVSCTELQDIWKIIEEKVAQKVMKFKEKKKIVHRYMCE